MKWNYFYDERIEKYCVFFKNDADHIAGLADTEQEAIEKAETLEKEGWATNDYIERREEFLKLVDSFA